MNYLEQTRQNVEEGNLESRLCCFAGKCLCLKAKNYISVFAILKYLSQVLLGKWLCKEPVRGARPICEAEGFFESLSQAELSQVKVPAVAVRQSYPSSQRQPPHYVSMLFKGDKHTDTNYYTYSLLLTHL